MIGSLSAKASAFESKLMLYIILGVVALVIVNLLLDGVRKFIRGLDTAALGALFIFLGYKASGFQLVNVLTENPGAHGMEGANPRFFCCVCADKRLHP